MPNDKATTEDTLITFSEWLKDPAKLQELGQHRLTRAIHAALEDRLGLTGSDPHIGGNSETEQVEPFKYWINLEVWNKFSPKGADQEDSIISPNELEQRVLERLTDQERKVVDELSLLPDLLKTHTAKA